MSKTLAQFNQLVNAEDYLEFFGLPYDPQFVNVNRLHILQKFSSLIKAIDSEAPDLDEFEKLKRYQTALEQAYNTFTTSSPLDEKLFKVFNDKPQNVVLLSEIGSD
ncbi:nitrogenase-stabilizing/protective protein NifW [Leptothermofonsia sichuanensis E412]|jgi:nitrogenase-stabilizing/protective protein|uniref:nitrogenase-stabilizing/protective protein NifW n=1 Tax=Leptothermofonsia sichuanensis TaxID=2917832 RepID=UPI001CA6D659|nr:nitrogenase-stabilizing/protective protein NifW [Leptothermofonsia sichuanensis]QZZ18647.1 nitrogenase-stabilizing/protective protein NifW [Leptothermofonsia sichuanensis E412]